MDPLSLATLITTAILSALTLIMQIFQSFKENHFKSDCCGGHVEIDTTMKDT